MAHSQTLDRDLRLVTHNGLLGLRLLPGCLAYYSGLAEDDLASLSGPPEDVHDKVPHDNRDKSGNSDYIDIHHVEEDNDGEDTPNDLGFLAIDEMRSQHMTQKQAQAVRNNVDELKEGPTCLEQPVSW